MMTRTIGIRWVANTGYEGAVIEPEKEDIRAHLRKMKEAGFVELEWEQKDPLRPLTVVSALFTVPTVRIVEFERLAGSYRHARVFRPL